jgi:GT2 family glycosyltransferase
MIVLAVPTLRCYDLLERLFASAEAGTRKPDVYAVVDNGGKLVESGVKLPPNTIVHDFGRNIGVAASWNYLIRTHGSDGKLVVVSNDDVIFHPHAVANLAKAVEDHPDVDFFSPNYLPGAMFCVFLVRRNVLDQIGPFDEGFWPAYFEDVDFHRRMNFAGVRVMSVDDVAYEHAHSATLKAASASEQAQHHETFKRNQQRYISKWGGLPGHETLTEAMVVAQPALPLQKTAEVVGFQPQPKPVPRPQPKPAPRPQPAKIRRRPPKWRR